MNDTTPWQEWSATWRDLEAGHDSIDALRASVDRGTVRLRWLRRGEWISTAVMLAVFVGGLGAFPERERRWWIVAVGIHVAVVYGFTLWNRRGTHAPLGESTAEYLRLARLRLSRARRTAAFMAGFVAVEAVAMAGYLSTRTAPAARPMAVMIGLALLTTFAAVWFRRRAGRQLARLNRWAGELEA